MSPPLPPNLNHPLFVRPVLDLDRRDLDLHLDALRKVGRDERFTTTRGLRTDQDPAARDLFARSAVEHRGVEGRELGLVVARVEHESGLGPPIASLPQDPPEELFVHDTTARRPKEREDRGIAEIRAFTKHEDG